MFAIWYVLPPSTTWFQEPRLLPFAGATCLVALLSVAAAWLHDRFWARMLNKPKTCATLAVQPSKSALKVRLGCSQPVVAREGAQRP
jgi:membrane protein implicated in regulation of membrane protease activity